MPIFSADENKNIKLDILKDNEEIKKRAIQRFGLLTSGADGGTRTHKVSHTPLKRARLPVSPHPQISKIY